MGRKPQFRNHIKIDPYSDNPGSGVYLVTEFGDMEIPFCTLKIETKNILQICCDLRCEVGELIDQHNYRYVSGGKVQDGE